MRSRYAAYALGLADYIIKTTHPTNPHYSSNKSTWRKEILLFSQETQFINLKILEWVDGAESADVTFRVELRQGNHDVSFTEKSHFVKEQGIWLYQSGIVQTPN